MVDTHDSGSCDFTVMGVRVPPRALFLSPQVSTACGLFAFFRSTLKLVEWIKKEGKGGKILTMHSVIFKELKTLRTLKAGQGFSEAVADTEA